MEAVWCMASRDAHNAGQPAASSDPDSILDAFDQPLLVVDGAGRVVAVNRTFRQLFNMAPMRGTGSTHDFSHLRSALLELISGQDDIQDMELEFHVSGERRTMRVSASPWSVGRGRGDRLVAISDVTDRHRADAALERREHELELLHRVLIAANESTDVSELFRVTLDRVCEHAGWPVGHIWLAADDNPARLVSTRIWHVNDEERFRALRLRSEGLDAVPPDDLVARVRASAAPLWVTDAAGSLGSRLRNDVRAAIAAPILVGTDVAGVLEFLTDVPAVADDLFLLIVRNVGLLLGRAVERNRAQDALRAANAALEQRIADRTASLEAANRELESFTYSVAHDLRGPLRAIDGFAHILVDTAAGTLDDRAQRYLGLVQANAERLGRLIDDLLLFSRLGRQALRKQLLAPTQLVREVLEQLAGEYEGRDIEVFVQDLPICYADLGLLKQVFTNLLSNALKFTRPRAHARIEVGSRNEGATPGYHVYFVRDDGVGFDMQYAHKIFGVFERLHREEEFEGTGVGLAIIQRIIDRHGGRVWAEGELDRGATFYFSLPAGSGHE